MSALLELADVTRSFGRVQAAHPVTLRNPNVVASAH